MRNQGALQVAVPGSQSHGMQLPQEKHRAPAEPWRGAGQDRCEPSGTAIGHPLETPSSSCAAFWPGGCVLMKYIVGMTQGKTVFKEGNGLGCAEKALGDVLRGGCGRRSPSSPFSPFQPFWVKLLTPRMSHKAKRCHCRRVLGAHPSLKVFLP